MLDDNREFRMALRRSLLLERFTVLEAEDIASLARILEETHVDVIVADSRLADGSDGWREARTLASRFPRTAVLFMSAYEADEIEAVEGQVVPSFIRKGQGVMQVVDAVLRVMGI